MMGHAEMTITFIIISRQEKKKKKREKKRHDLFLYRALIMFLYKKKIIVHFEL